MARTVEKPLMLGKAAFHASFGRPQHSQKILRHTGLAHRREASALWAVARSAKRPEGAPEGSVCPVGTWAEGPKRPKGVSKYKGCARPARRTPIFARERNERRARPAPSAKIERPGKAGRYECIRRAPEGSVCPVGTCHRRWQSAPEESTETSGGRGQRSPRRLRLRTCGPPSLPKRVSPKRRGRVPAVWERGRAVFYCAAPLEIVQSRVGGGVMAEGRDSPSLKR